MAGVGGEDRVDRLALVVGQRPERLAERDRGLRVLDPLTGQVFPTPLERGLHGLLDDLGPFVVGIGDGAETLLVAFDDLLHHPGRRHARQVRPAGGAGHRETESDQIVGRIADDGLVEVADLDRDGALGTGDRTDVARVAVATDPDRRPGGHRLAGATLEPVVEVLGVAAHVGMCGSRHLQLPPGLEGRRSLGGRGERDILHWHSAFLLAAWVVTCSITLRP